MSYHCNWDEEDKKNAETGPTWKVIVPDGWYHCKIRDVKEKGYPVDQWSIEFEHLGAPRFTTTKFIKFPSVLWILRCIYKALGLPHHGDMILDPMDIHGKELLIYCQKESYQSKTGEVVTKMGIKAGEFKSVEEIKATNSVVTIDKDNPF